MRVRARKKRKKKQQQPPPFSAFSKMVKNSMLRTEFDVFKFVQADKRNNNTHTHTHETAFTDAPKRMRMLSKGVEMEKHHRRLSCVVGSCLFKISRVYFVLYDSNEKKTSIGRLRAASTIERVSMDFGVGREN